MFLPSRRETPFASARLSEADNGKIDVGLLPLLTAFHTYKVIDVPDTAEPYTVELKLTRGLSRRGRVVGPDSKPVTGAKCYGLVATLDYIKTLSDDRFEVHGLEPDAPRQLIFERKDRQLVASVVIKGDDAKNDAPIEVRLEPAGSVKGRLVDEEGRPLSGAKLIFVSSDLLSTGSRYSADADGRFHIVGLIPGIKGSIILDKQPRAINRLDTGGVLDRILVQHPAEVRNLGDVTVKELPASN